MDMNGNIIYAVDFDGTLSLGAKWPDVGAPNVPLIEYLKQKKSRRRPPYSLDLPKWKGS